MTGIFSSHVMMKGGGAGTLLIDVGIMLLLRIFLKNIS